MNRPTVGESLAAGLGAQNTSKNHQIVGSLTVSSFKLADKLVSETEDR